MKELQQLFREAQRRGRALPVPIRRAICVEGAQAIIDFNNLGVLLRRDMLQMQGALDKAVEAGGLGPRRKGVMASVVYWDGDTGLVAGYEQESGIAVGYGHLHHHPQDQWDEQRTQIPTYTDEFLVASEYTRSGIGMAMAELLSGMAAMNTIGFGARILSTIEAKDPGHRIAVEKSLVRLGAVRQEHDGVVRYQRIVLQPEMFHTIGNQQPPFVESTVQDIGEKTWWYPGGAGRVYTRGK